MTNQGEPLVRELTIIPRWAIALAALTLAGAVIGLLVLFERVESNPPPLPFQAFFGLMVGLFLASLVLLVGYVNRDARRRGMNVALWTLLVIFVPNAIGFILYFLLRNPVPVACPRCGALAVGGSKFCPQCGSRLGAACPSCGHTPGMGDAHCSNCGHALAVGT